MFLFIYYSIYTMTMFNLFIIILRFNYGEFRTLSDLKEIMTDTFSVGTFSVSLLSMAGVPPLAGFFTKMFLFKVLVNSTLSTFFVFFLFIILAALFFYLQNWRFVLVSAEHRADTIRRGVLWDSVLCVTALFVIDFILISFTVFLSDMLTIVIYFFLS